MFIMSPLCDWWLKVVSQIVCENIQTMGITFTNIQWHKNN